METTEIVAIYGAIVGTVSLIATTSFKALDAWRDRASVSVDYYWALVHTPNPIRELQIQATLRGRRPVKVLTAGIALKKNIIRRRPWQKPIRNSIQFMPSFPGVRSDFPKVLEERDPIGNAYMSVDLISGELTRSGDEALTVWVSTAKGRIEKKLSASTCKTLRQSNSSGTT